MPTDSAEDGGVALNCPALESTSTSYEPTVGGKSFMSDWSSAIHTTTTFFASSYQLLPSLQLSHSPDTIPTDVAEAGSVALDNPALNFVSKSLMSIGSSAIHITASFFASSLHYLALELGSSVKNKVKNNSAVDSADFAHKLEGKTRTDFCDVIAVSTYGLSYSPHSAHSHCSSWQSAAGDHAFDSAGASAKEDHSPSVSQFLYDNTTSVVQAALESGEHSPFFLALSDNFTSVVGAAFSDTVYQFWCAALFILIVLAAKSAKIRRILTSLFCLALSSITHRAYFDPDVDTLSSYLSFYVFFLFSPVALTGITFAFFCHFINRATQSKQTSLLPSASSSPSPPLSLHRGEGPRPRQARGGGRGWRLAGTLVGLVLARDVKGAELSVSTQTELFHKVSNRVESGVTTGNSIMAQGDTVTVSSGTYSGSEIAARGDVMFILKDLHGLLQCEEALQCDLNGEGTRRVMAVDGCTGGGCTGGGVWTMKGLRFVDGKSTDTCGTTSTCGGGLFTSASANVEMTMCEFNNNQATNVSAFRLAAF